MMKSVDHDIINIEDGIKQSEKLNKNYKISNDNEEKKAKTCVNICKIMCILILTIPLMITDLYFGYSNQNCLSIKFDGIDFGIGTWLQVSGFIQLSSIVLLILSQLTAEEYSKILTKIISIFFGLFFVGWNIVGAIIFWKYLEPNSICDSQLTNYLWARIIIGLINSGSILLSK
jgi:hypothetical protein